MHSRPRRRRPALPLPLLAALLSLARAPLLAGTATGAADFGADEEAALANSIMHTLSPATFTGGSAEDAARAAKIRSRVQFGGWHGDGEHAAKIAKYERAEEEDVSNRP